MRLRSGVWPVRPTAGAGRSWESGPLIPWIVLAGIVILALWIRVGFRGFESIDFRDSLSPWYEFLKSRGGVPGLKDLRTEYPPLYLYAIALMTYLPVKPLYAFKGLSILFDLFTAGLAFGLVKRRYPEDFAPALLAFGAVLFWPTVILNSSLWAQCDSIFTGLVLAALCLLLRQRNAWAMAAYGLAVAVKLQALFVLPLFAVYLLKKRIDLRYLCIAPLVYLLAGVPMLLLGQTFSGTYLYMLYHAGLFQNLTKHALTLYQWVPDGFYAYFVRTGVIWAGAVIAAIGLISARYLKRLEQDEWVELAWLFALVVPFLLPKMHERYFYLAEVIGIIYACHFPNRFYLVVILGALSYFSYEPFLFGTSIMDQKYLSLGMAAIVLAALYHWVRRLQGGTAIVPGGNRPGPIPPGRNPSR